MKVQSKGLISMRGPTFVGGNNGHVYCRNPQASVLTLEVQLYVCLLVVRGLHEFKSTLIVHYIIHLFTCYSLVVHLLFTYCSLIDHFLYIFFAFLLYILVFLLTLFVHFKSSKNHKVKQQITDNKKNTAYGRHRISRRVQIVELIQV